MTKELAAARACTLCADVLPLGPRPIVQASATARLLIIGQAPGTRVHASGTPWDDPSGERLRDWMGITSAVLHDETRVAIVPMGLCYPGRQPRGGDAPPRPECAPLWHPRLLPLMPQIGLTLLVGSYALAAALGRGPMTPMVANWRALLPARVPLPHPSWRALLWERKNPWFRDELVPDLRRRVAEVLT
jgi:uracil-DNA glycosylase